jgi:hypothetical protein
MLANRKLVLDSNCEVYGLLKPYADNTFQNIVEHTAIPDAVYLISLNQFTNNVELITQLIESHNILPILSSPMEGSETLKNYCQLNRFNGIDIANLIHAGKILLIGGGDMDPSWHCHSYDNFLPKILDYNENLLEISRSNEIFSKTNKPYKFLFLNGRQRHHRKYLLEKFKWDGILDQSLWTNLDAREVTFYPFVLPPEVGINNRELTAFQVKQLPIKYEVPRYQQNLTNTEQDQYTKKPLFNNDWGEIYLSAEPYIDTYFSVVTETVFEYPYSFRTEKTWKPVAMGHPCIFASNYGYYRDFHNLGFRTWGQLIDETFDMIENVQDRILRISEVVKDLCNQDLPAFLAAAEETCKYNQQHLAEMRIKVRGEFPDRFFQFINKHINE